MRSVCTLLILSGLVCVCGTAERPPPAAPQYRLVEGWPDLPDHITLGQVSGIAVDAQDRIWVLHRGESPVLCFTREGAFLRGFGDGYFPRAHGLEIAPDQTVWATDIEDHVVMQFSPEGALLRTLGTRGEPGESATHFDQPTDIAFAPSGAFYVSDGYGNARVVKFSKEYEFENAWGDSGAGEGQFVLPHAVALDSRGRVFVCDRTNSRMQIFSPEGEFLAMWTHVGQPWGVAITPEDMVYVVDGRDMKATLLTAEGEIVTTWGSEGTAPGQFTLAHHVAVDSHGDVYVVEITNQRVQKFTTAP